MTTVMFPGQGSQRTGMGKDLFPTFPHLVRQADQVLGYSIQHLCLEAPTEQLAQTEYTQPALFVVNTLHYLAKLRRDPARPDFFMGHSLGEYNALYAAGVFDFQTGLELVMLRGQLMSQARQGAMAAVLGLSYQRVQEILAAAQAADCDLANHNSPEQVVISGPRTTIHQLQSDFKDAGARHYVVLKVGAAFHSRYMTEAQESFRKHLTSLRFAPPTRPVISNLTGRPYRPGDTADLLSRQITGSVNWYQGIRYLIDHQEDQFEEIGPGTALSGLLRKIQRHHPLPESQ